MARVGSLLILSASRFPASGLVLVAQPPPGAWWGAHSIPKHCTGRCGKPLGVIPPGEPCWGLTAPKDATGTAGTPSVTSWYLRAPWGAGAAQPPPPQHRDTRKGWLLTSWRRCSFLSCAISRFLLVSASRLRCCSSRICFISATWGGKKHRHGVGTLTSARVTPPQDQKPSLLPQAGQGFRLVPWKSPRGCSQGGALPARVPSPSSSRPPPPAASSARARSGTGS